MRLGYVYFIDSNGDIIVPKAVRPIIDYHETYLGDKKRSKRQFRYGNLHIREYDDVYTIHVDKIDPRKDPLAHLLLDAPEYLIGILSAVSVGKKVGYAVYNGRRAEGKNQRIALNDGITAGYIAASVAGTASYIVSDAIKKKMKRSMCK